MSSESPLSNEMSKKISLFGLTDVKLWVLVCFVVGTFVALVLFILYESNEHDVVKFLSLLGLKLVSPLP